MGVDSNITDADLKKVWLKKMRENHPDVGGDPRKAQEINAAYQEILLARGRRDSIWAEGFSPENERDDGPSTDYYRNNPEARAKKVETQAKINRKPEERARRAALNKERRKRGIAGKGGPDISHKASGGTTLEDPSTNRGRNGHGSKPRLKP